MWNKDLGPNPTWPLRDSNNRFNWNKWCLQFDRKIRLGCRKHNGKRFTSLPQNCHIRYGLNPKMGGICVEWVWNREGTEKLVNGKQHSVWFVPTGMKGLPQNVLLNFRLEFPKSDLTIYPPSGISEIFRQMVSTQGLHHIPACLFPVFFFSYRPERLQVVSSFSFESQ